MLGYLGTYVVLRLALTWTIAVLGAKGTHIRLEKGPTNSRLGRRGFRHMAGQLPAQSYSLARHRIPDSQRRTRAHSRYGQGSGGSGRSFSGMRVAVAGAGIYGSTIAIRLAEHGHRVDLFDSLGVMRAASVINQFRVHAGYHYPRSPETIDELLEAQTEFLETFGPAIVKNSRHYYAIPKQNSRTAPEMYQRIMAEHKLRLTVCHPDWLNFDFIDTCYEVEEHVYDPEILRLLIEGCIANLGIQFRPFAYSPEMKGDYDFSIWATYGLSGSRGVFKKAKFQIAEKILIELPHALGHISLVLVDGPFTAFDPYGSSALSLFGSAQHTNHWSTKNADEPIPEIYSSLLNAPSFKPAPFTRFEAMREDCRLAVPAAQDAVYLGSGLRCALSKIVRNKTAGLCTSRKATQESCMSFPAKW